MVTSRPENFLQSVGFSPSLGPRCGAGQPQPHQPARPRLLTVLQKLPDCRCSRPRDQSSRASNSDAAVSTFHVGRGRMMTSRRTRSAQAVTQNVGAAHSALPGPGRPGERTREAAAGPRLPGSSVGPRAAHPGSRGRRPALSAVLRQALGVVPELKRRWAPQRGCSAYL